MKNREKETECCCSVGELCERYQITRKTLFYYDRKGLVKPTERVGSQNFKMYDRKAEEDLQRVLMYRRAGLTIEEIRLIQDESCKDPLSLLSKVKERLESEIESTSEMMANLEELMKAYQDS